MDAGIWTFGKILLLIFFKREGMMMFWKRRDLGVDYLVEVLRSWILAMDVGKDLG